MNCETCHEHISELVDNEMIASESARLYRHLSECPSCRSFLRSSLKLKEVIHSISVNETISQGYKEKTGWFQRNIRLPLPAAAVCVLLLIGGIIGTSLNFMHGDDPVVTDKQEIIYISDYPEIEIYLLTDME